jgi:hypothetical protein
MAKITNKNQWIISYQINEKDARNLPKGDPVVRKFQRTDY